MLAVPVPVTGQDRQGRAQDKPLDSKRTGFAPAVARFANLVQQDVATWGALPGSAAVTPGTTAPDGTTGAATLSIASPPEGYKRLYSTTGAVAAGDYVVAGVWVKAISVRDQSGQSASIEDYKAATLTIWDETEGYQLDSEATNARHLKPTDRADSEWEWVTAAAKITRAPSSRQGQIRFDLNADWLHTVAFYAPVLHHIPTGRLSDDEAEGLLQNLYPVPKGAAPGTIALLKDQSLSGIVYDAGGGWINVKSHKYGAIGDGETDDTDEIQAAIADAASTGKAIYFPEGRYRISSALTGVANGFVRSEERRVGKECRSRWSPYH